MVSGISDSPSGGPVSDAIRRRRRGRSPRPPGTASLARLRASSGVSRAKIGRSPSWRRRSTYARLRKTGPPTTACTATPAPPPPVAHRLGVGREVGLLVRQHHRVVVAAAQAVLPDRARSSGPPAPAQPTRRGPPPGASTRRGPRARRPAEPGLAQRALAHVPAALGDPHGGGVRHRGVEVEAGELEGPRAQREISASARPATPRPRAQGATQYPTSARAASWRSMIRPTAPSNRPSAAAATASLDRLAPRAAPARPR